MAVTHVLQYKTGLAPLPFILKTMNSSGSNHDYGYGITANENREWIITGRMNSGPINAITQKYDSDGNTVWQRAFTSGYIGSKHAIDSAGNVYGVLAFDVFKYNSSGVLQWQRRLNDVSVSDVAVDSSGNVFACGSTNNTMHSGRNGFIAKIDSSGGYVHWQQDFGIPANDENVNSIAVDSSGNVIICGHMNSGDESFIIKYNNTGTLQWEKMLDNSNSQRLHGVVVDGSGNIYAGGLTGATGEGGTFVVKLNGSGVVQWQKYLSGGYEARAIAYESITGHVYLTGGDGSGDVSCVDSNGNLQWHRRIDRTAPVGPNTTSFHGIDVDNKKNVYIVGQTTVSETDVITVRIPNTGDAVGSVSNGIYTFTCSIADPAVTAGNTTHTIANAGFTYQASSQAFQTPTNPESATTYTDLDYT